MGFGGPYKNHAFWLYGDKVGSKGSDKQKISSNLPLARNKGLRLGIWGGF